MIAYIISDSLVRDLKKKNILYTANSLDDVLACLDVNHFVILSLKNITSSFV